MSNSLKGHATYRIIKRILKSKISLAVVVVGVLFAAVEFGLLTKIMNVVNESKKKPIPTFATVIEVNHKTLKQFSAKTGYSTGMLHNSRVTAYANRVEETDSTPNIGACDRQVYEGSIAVSQDLFRKKLNCGDTICLTKTKECYVVEDTMNARFKNSMDIFTYNHKVARTTLFHTDVVYFRVVK